jgi:hypothetical protein
MSELNISTEISRPATIADFLKTEVGSDMLCNLEIAAEDIGIGLDNALDGALDAKNLSLALEELDYLSSTFKSLADFTDEIAEALLDHKNAHERAHHSLEAMQHVSDASDYSQHMRRFREDFENVCLSNRPLQAEFRKDLLEIGMPDVVDRRKVKTYRQAYYAVSERLFRLERQLQQQDHAAAE